MNQGTYGWAHTSQVEYISVSAFDPDSDEDGIPDDVDLCPGTQIPESVPTIELKPNRWALVNGDMYFDTLVKGQGNNPNRTYSLLDTNGCSAEQIIDILELGNGHTQFGLSSSAIEEFISFISN